MNWKMISFLFLFIILVSITLGVCTKKVSERSKNTLQEIKNSMEEQSKREFEQEKACIPGKVVKAEGNQVICEIDGKTKIVELNESY